MGRSLSVHCHLMALIVCCSVQHKPSRQASPSTCTTSATHKGGRGVGGDKRNLPFGRTKERYVLDKMSVLGIQIQIRPQHRKNPTFLNERTSEWLSTVILKGSQSKSSQSMACHVREKPNLSYLASYPDFYSTPQFLGFFLFFFFPRISRQTAGRGQLFVRLHPPNDRISTAEKEQANACKSTRWNPTRLSTGLSCSARNHPYRRILPWSLAAGLVLRLQHHDPWDSSQTPHVTAARWCKQPAHYY